MPEEPSEQEIRRFEEDRHRFEAEAVGRLSNVLPLDAARNEGRFYGQVIRGRPLSGVQRIGFFLIGSMFCFLAALVFLSAFPGLRRLTGLPNPFPWETSSLPYVPFNAICFLLGLAAVVKAFAPNAPNKHQ